MVMPITRRNYLDDTRAFIAPTVLQKVILDDWLRRLK
jgi:hypothetical protein